LLPSENPRVTLRRYEDELTSPSWRRRHSYFYDNLWAVP